MSHYYKDYGLKTPLKRARDLGSAKSGSHHWWVTKLTAIALSLLSLWLFFSLLDLANDQATYHELIDWVQAPMNTILLIAFFGIGHYHAAVGGQEVIIDYVKDKPTKITALLLYYLFHALLGAAGIYGVFHIAFQM